MKHPHVRALLAVIGGMALAACSAQQSSTAAVGKPAPGEAAARKAVAALAPGAKDVSVRPAPIPGMTEVDADGQIAYVTNDGKYLFAGNIIDVASKRDLTELTRSAKRREMIGKLSSNQMVVFAPPHPKYTVTVFTDVDCAFCRKLHSQIADYNKAGIAVDYLFFPRSGIGSPSYDKAVSVWCSANRQQALTDAKKGMALPKATCANPVKQDYELGLQFGLEGTPAIYAADGTTIGGYLSPAEMKEKLDQLAASPNG